MRSVCAEEERLRREAEGRLAELDALQREAEERLGGPEGRGGEPGPGEPSGSRPSIVEPAPGPGGVDTIEERLADGQRRAEEALERAVKQLEEVEARAAEAEARAARLVQLRADEGEREGRLRELLERIAAADRRARRAEDCAWAAVAAIEAGADPAPPPMPEAAAIPQPPEPPPEADLERAPEAERLDLNAASYDQLRALKLSVTQSDRILSFRDRSGGFRSVNELEDIPGFPRATLDELRGRLRV
jgi:hypothetical protein